MTALADHLDVSARFARSANLERDITDVVPLDGYVVTARAIDIVERLASTATQTQAGGAWSITGPYGSGKSSLAVLIDGAFGEAGRVRDKALDLLHAVAPEVSAAVESAHAKHETVADGFHRAVVTASREPVGQTVLRALHSAVVRRFGKIPPASKFSAATSLKSALADAASDDPRRTGPSPSSILDGRPLPRRASTTAHRHRRIRQEPRSRRPVHRHRPVPAATARRSRPRIRAPHLHAHPATPVLRGLLREPGRNTTTRVGQSSKAASKTSPTSTLPPKPAPSSAPSSNPTRS